MTGHMHLWIVSADLENSSKCSILNTQPLMIKEEMFMLPTQPDGYLAMPATGKGSTVLVLHAWWGLNDTRAGYLLHF